MKQTVRTGTALLLLLLPALPAPGQESASGPGEPPLSAGPGTAETEGGEIATAQNDAAAKSPGATEPGNPAPEPGTSPFDYRPSEQISEDLSVSFPVDI